MGVCVGIISIATLPNETPRRRLPEKKVTVYHAGTFEGNPSFAPDGQFTRSIDGTFSYVKKIGDEKDWFFLQITQGLVKLKIKDITFVTANVDVDGKTELLEFSNVANGATFRDETDDICFIVSGLDKEWVKNTILSCSCK